MALVPVTENEPVSSSCCRIFYETSINELTVRRMIFKNVKRLSPQTGLLENRPFLDENGRFLAAKEIKPDQKIQTDKIEIENQSRRRRSSSNLGLVTYKTLPHYYRVLDKLYVAKLPPTISATVNSNLLATVSLFDSAAAKLILATKTHNDKKHSMQVVIKKEPSYEEILTDSIINELPRCRSQSANTSGSKTSGSKDFSPVSDRKKLQNLQKESSEYVTLIKVTGSKSRELGSAHSILRVEASP